MKELIFFKELQVSNFIQAEFLHQHFYKNF